MKIERFNALIQEQLDHSFTVLTQKGKEYSLTADRLDHFKDAAVDQGSTLEQALWGMASKHIASISSMCKNGAVDLALWREKITDSINYLLLLWAVVNEDGSDEKN